MNPANPPTMVRTPATGMIRLDAGYAPSASEVRLRSGPPIKIPASRGPVSEELLQILDDDPSRPLRSADLDWHGRPEQALTDEDLQLALWLTEELRYGGLVGVDERWRCHPQLSVVRQEWESALEAGGRIVLADRFHDRTAELAEFLVQHASSTQFSEFLIHRSMDRLRAEPTDLTTRLVEHVLRDWDLDDHPGSHLDQVPAVTLLGGNVAALLGRRLRPEAVVGFRARTQQLTSLTYARCAAGHRRLGGGDTAAECLEELGEVAGVAQLPNLSAEPRADLWFGARCAALVDGLLADHLLASWRAGRSSLRPSPRHS